MCEPKPSPRCSDHATETLMKARAAYYRSDGAEGERYDLLAAHYDYYRTTKGIQELRELAHIIIKRGLGIAEGENLLEQVNLLEAERNILIAAYQETQKHGNEVTAVKDNITDWSPLFTYYVEDELKGQLARTITTHTPDEESVFWGLCEEFNYTVLMTFAEREDLPLELQEHLVNLYEEVDVRAELAMNPSLLPHLQEYLAYDDEPQEASVSLAVMFNPNLDEGLQWKLADHGDREMRAALVYNCDLNTDILTFMVGKETDPLVLDALLSRCDTFDGFRKRLTTGADGVVNDEDYEFLDTLPTSFYISMVKSSFSDGNDQGVSDNFDHYFG